MEETPVKKTMNPGFAKGLVFGLLIASVIIGIIGLVGALIIVFLPIKFQTMNNTATPTPTVTTTATPTTSTATTTKTKISYTWTEPYAKNKLTWSYYVDLPTGYTFSNTSDDFNSRIVIKKGAAASVTLTTPAEAMGSYLVKKESVIKVGTLSNGQTVYRGVSINYFPGQYIYFNTVETDKACSDEVKALDVEAMYLTAPYSCANFGFFFGTNKTAQGHGYTFVSVSKGISDADLKEFDQLVLSLKL